MTASDPHIPLIEALDLRPATEAFEVVWDWRDPPAVSLDEKQGDPHTFPGVAADRPN